MNSTRFLTVVLVLTSLLAVSCQGENSDTVATWAVPGFETDFSQRQVNPEDILSGGPPKDGIPAIDSPIHQSVAEAESYLDKDEPVILVTVGNRQTIYPIRVLTWHEIVNDTVGKLPLTVTFCPLCNTSIVFRRDFEGRILDFGTTGRLLGSNLIMYDRQTESWWQQATGEGIVGEHTGEQLEIYPSQTLSFAEAVAVAPEALVLSQTTGFDRPYGQNPYSGYDRPGNKPFLFKGPLDSSRNPMERAVVVRHKGEEYLLSYDELSEEGIHQFELSGEFLVLLFSPGARSALDTESIASGRKVGSINAYISEVDSKPAVFTADSIGLYRDSVSGSLWNGAGVAESGPEEGSRLEPVATIQHFWFSADFFSGQ